jgi:hypothetical protein
MISIVIFILFCFQDTYANAENILFSAFEEYEEILCTSVGLSNVWGQILPDPFLRRLILRYIIPYIFCTQSNMSIWQLAITLI